MRQNPCPQGVYSVVKDTEKLINNCNRMCYKSLTSRDPCKHKEGYSGKLPGRYDP